MVFIHLSNLLRTVIVYDSRFNDVILVINMYNECRYVHIVNILGV